MRFLPDFLRNLRSSGKLRLPRLRLFVVDEYKPLRLVPPLMWPLTLGALAAQIVFTINFLPPPDVRQTDYDSPPSETLFQFAALGEPETLAKLLVLRLQAFDNQPGVSVPFRELNYHKLGEWLDRAVALDERAEYPHFLMSKVYFSVNDAERREIATRWVWRQFLRRPNERWWWMAHNTSAAKHVIKNDALALQMAKSLRQNTDPALVPGWPRQMEAFFLENQDEFDAAAAILLNQLEGGDVTDPQEFGFLVDRLNGILEKMAETGQIASNAELQEKIDQVDDLYARFLAQFEETAQANDNAAAQ